MLYDEAILDAVRTTLIVTLKIAAPILAAGVAIGLIISILQSITTIQDQALTFVPKVITMFLVAVLLLPWIAMRLIEFATEMLTLR
jgi:flagellar biosynthetic protein FliQ